jgi:hypothetical protein
VGHRFLVAHPLAKKVGKSILAYLTSFCLMNPLKKPARNLQTGEGWEKVWFKEERTTD